MRPSSRLRLSRLFCDPWFAVEAKGVKCFFAAHHLKWMYRDLRSSRESASFLSSWKDADSTGCISVRENEIFSKTASFIRGGEIFLVSRAINDKPGPLRNVL